MKNALRVILPAILLLSVSIPVFADSVVQLSFGGYYYPVPTAFDITGTNGNYVMFMRTSGFNQASYSGNNGVLPFHKASTYNLQGNLNLSPGDTFAAFAFAGPLSGPCTGNNPAACRASPQFRGEADAVFGVAPPPPPPPYTWFDPTVISPAFTAGVVNTAAMLWPMFSVVGILIAFWIGEMVIAFIRNSAKKSSSYKEDYTPEQVGRITDKIKELGDRDSFDE